MHNYSPVIPLGFISLVVKYQNIIILAPSHYLPFDALGALA